MSYSPSVTSRITRNTTSVNGATFNFPIFCAPHMYFADIERVRSYGSWTELQADTDIVVGSDTYNAVRLAMTQTPAPDRVYVGRQKADSLILTPSIVGVTLEYGFTVTVTETATSTAVTTISSITSDASPTAVEIATAIFTDVDTGGANAIANVTAVDNTGSVSITPDAGFTVQLKAVVRLADTYTSTETAAQLLAAIQEEDNDWYFMCASNHTEAFQLDMAASIEATGSSDFPKMYFTSTASADSIVALPDPAIDVIGKLKEFGYTRTSCDWHDDADTLFPELGDVAYNGVYQAGTTTWKFMQVAGVTAAADLVTGKRLSTGKQGFINDRNGNWMGFERGTKFMREGKTTSGEWIDIIRATDWLNDEIEVELLNLLLNQKGGKIPFTNAGQQQVKGTVDKVLDRAVGLGILESYIPTSMPDIGDVPFADKVARILENVKWTGYLAGAIHTIIVDGNLTYSQSELV